MSNDKVYQILANSELFEVLEQRTLETVTGMFIDSDAAYAKQYDDRVPLYPELGAPEGDTIQLHGYHVSGTPGQNQICLIRARTLVDLVLAGLEKNKQVPWSAPVSFHDHTDGLAMYNRWFALRGIKYVQSKEHFIKAPAKKAKQLPKAAVNALKKDIVDVGRKEIARLTGATINSFAIASNNDVDGAAYLIKLLGLNYKNFKFPVAPVWVPEKNSWVIPQAVSFGARVEFVGELKKLTNKHKDELMQAIAEWWNGLEAPLKEENLI